MNLYKLKSDRGYWYRSGRPGGRRYGRMDGTSSDAERICEPCAKRLISSIFDAFEYTLEEESAGTGQCAIESKWCLSGEEGRANDRNAR